jgi:hypothetical protein
MQIFSGNGLIGQLFLDEGKCTVAGARGVRQFARLPPVGRMA